MVLMLQASLLLQLGRLVQGQVHRPELSELGRHPPPA